MPGVKGGDFLAEVCMLNMGMVAVQLEEIAVVEMGAGCKESTRGGLDGSTRGRKDNIAVQRVDKAANREETDGRGRYKQDIVEGDISAIVDS